MSNFWTSGTGNAIDGSPDKAFIKEFSVIPNNTMALGRIEKFELLEVQNQRTGEYMNFYQITWKLTAGEFTGQQVQQKIKTFDGKPEQIDRALNMLKLVMNLCKFVPQHMSVPTQDDLKPMLGKVLGVKIREWAMPKEDGTGYSQGNFISEVHPTEGFVCETGMPLLLKETLPAQAPTYDYEATKAGRPTPTALDRNPRVRPAFVDDDIPFM